MFNINKKMKRKIIFVYFILLLIIQIKSFIKYSSYRELEINLSSKINSIKRIGRYYIKDDIIYLSQSGSSIEFYLTAKSAMITIYGGKTYLHDDYEKPRYAIYLNDKKFLDEKIQSMHTKILLFNYDTIREVKIKIILLSEAFFGDIGVNKLYFYSPLNEEDSIRPTEKKKYLIEFIGDSITCGYGIEAKAGGELFDTGTENFEKTYAYLSSQELNFDYSVVCYSGCGLIFPGNKMPERYNKINYYSKDYSNFLQIVREKNPDSIIICIYGMMGREDLFPLILEGIESLNDDKIYGFLFPEQKFEDGYGAQYHPNEVSNKKWAKILTAIIKNILVERNIK